MKITLPLALATAACVTLTTQAATLALGDTAPEFKPAKWVRGEAVPKLDPDKIYVVEFWATWCGPCRQSIPHLTELAHKFKDRVTFIGMDVWEKGDTEAREQTVTRFIGTMGDKMDYHVALDDNDFMADHWMKAGDMNGIPAAFVVDHGRIMWVGHPMSGLEETLAEITAGKFDFDKYRKRAAAQKKIDALFELAANGGNDAEIQKQAKELETLDKELGGLTPGEKFDAQDLINQARYSRATTAYETAFLLGEGTAKLAKLEAAAKAVAPKDADFAALKQELAHEKAAQPARDLFRKYTAAVREGGDKEKTAALAQKLEIAALKLKDAETLNDFAWTILTDEGIKKRDLPLATRLAKAALDASAGTNAYFLDTYARALFDAGKTSDAIEFQKKAVAACTDAEEKPGLEATLKEYRDSIAAQPK